jgi:hypothetical protein
MTKVEQDKPKGKPAFERPAGRSAKTPVTVGDVLTNKFEHLTVAEDKGEVEAMESTEA